MAKRKWNDYATRRIPGWYLFVSIYHRMRQHSPSWIERKHFQYVRRAPYGGDVNKINKNIFIKATLCVMLHYKFRTFIGREIFSSIYGRWWCTKRGGHDVHHALRGWSAPQFISQRAILFRNIGKLKCSPIYFAMMFSTNTSWFLMWTQSMHNFRFFITVLWTHHLTVFM